MLSFYNTTYSGMLYKLYSVMRGQWGLLAVVTAELDKHAELN